MATTNTPDQAPLQKRAVAGSFIFKYPEDGGRPLVALFRRSEKVRTYPHRLGSISGSIEKDDSSPLAAAWRELHEETALDSSSLELIRHGKPYSFGDASVGREWWIHPFAFRLKTAEEGGRGDAGITIDWEHEGWEWHDPRDVVDSDEFGGVPRIAESLRRVWFEKGLGEAAGSILARGLHGLKTDHQSGARQMAGDALELFRNVVEALEVQESREQWWASVRFAAWHIWKNGRESMGAAILSVLLRVMGTIEDTLQQQKEWPVVQCKASALQILQESISQRAGDPARSVAMAFASYLREHIPQSRLSDNSPVRILTLSESGTIKKALLYIMSESGFRLDLRILESRPLFEGISLAGELVSNIRSSMVQIAVYTDAAAALAAEDIDIVLLGADRIAGSGAVSNKTGSLPAVLSAKHMSPRVRTVVLSECEKISPPGDEKDHVVEENSPAQVEGAWQDNRNSERVRGAAATCLGGGNADSVPVFRVCNIFFEWVPT